MRVIARTIVLAAVPALLAAPAAGQSRCKVMDPTGTPLNIRAAPNGEVVGKAANGALVTIIETTRDSRGRPWAYVAHMASGQPLGWVFREFVACY